MNLHKTFQFKAQSKSGISGNMTLPHQPLWELLGHLFPARIASFRPQCHFIPSATLVAWLTKGKTVLAEPVVSQKLDHVQGIFLLFHYYSFPLQMLLLDVCHSAQMHCLLHRSWASTSHLAWQFEEKMLECLLQKNKHWLVLGNVTCVMLYFARPPWLHCLTLIIHINIWILDDNSWRLIPVSYSCLEVQISKQKHVG